MPNLEEIAGVVKMFWPLKTLTEKDVWDIVQKNDALLTQGHFDFGEVHSPALLQFTLIDGDKPAIGKLAQELAAQLGRRGIEGVICYNTTPLDLGTCVAQELDVSLNQAEPVDEQPVRLDVGSIRKRKKYLIIHDFSVTGKKVQKLISLLEDNGAKVAGIGMVAVTWEASRLAAKWLDRYKNVFRIAYIQTEHYSPGRCPLCKEGKPLQDSQEYE